MRIIRNGPIPLKIRMLKLTILQQLILNPVKVVRLQQSTHPIVLRRAGIDSVVQVLLSQASGQVKSVLNFRSFGQVMHPCWLHQNSRMPLLLNPFHMIVMLHLVLHLDYSLVLRYFIVEVLLLLQEFLLLLYDQGLWVEVVLLTLKGLLHTKLLLLLNLRIKQISEFYPRIRIKMLQRFNLLAQLYFNFPLVHGRLGVLLWHDLVGILYLIVHTLWRIVQLVLLLVQALKLPHGLGGS